ncbi:MAG: hypothetical protein OEW87_07745, partial [Flavobacteriaceae bacterium]|nr:hypothetical protein [Flavobacteriaceae bacterium]
RIISDLTANEYGAIETNSGSINFNAAQNALPSCASMNGKFLAFFLGDNTNLIKQGGVCASPLKDLLQSRWSRLKTADIYNSEYVISESASEELFSAYRPGPEHDADGSSGVQQSFFTGSPIKMIRNFYSTKFIALKSVIGTNSAYGKNDQMLIYSEGHPKIIGGEAKRSLFKNPINTSTLSVDISTANH